MWNFFLIVGQVDIKIIKQCEHECLFVCDKKFDYLEQNLASRLSDSLHYSVLSQLKIAHVSLSSKRNCETFKS